MNKEKKKLDAEIVQLVSEGVDMMRAHNESDPKKKRLLNALDYEEWYTRAIPCVRFLLPDRLNEFQDLYKIGKGRSQLSLSTYRISDYIGGISLVGRDSASIAIGFFKSQLAIFRSARSRIDTVLEDVKTELRRELFDSDIDSAKALLKGKHLRAAGAICGVVIEKHLALVCAGHGVVLKKKDPAIGDYAAELKASSVVNLQMFKKIDHLGSIRNKCCHHKGDEPTKAEVQDLITGTIDVLNSVG